MAEDLSNSDMYEKIFSYLNGEKPSLGDRVFKQNGLTLRISEGRGSISVVHEEAVDKVCAEMGSDGSFDNISASHFSVEDGWKEVESHMDFTAQQIYDLIFIN